MSSAIQRAVRRAALGPAVADGEGGGRQEFRFDPGFPGFSGHFPGFPILPGVVQVECARVAAERLWGRAFSPAGVENAKFLAPVLPGDRLLARLSLAPPSSAPPSSGSSRVFSARLTVEGKPVAVFTLTLVEVEGAPP